jgi:hypothetical protein
VQAGTAAAHVYAFKIVWDSHADWGQCKEDHPVRPSTCHNTEVELEDGALVAAMHKNMTSSALFLSI